MKESREKISIWISDAIPEGIPREVNEGIPERIPRETPKEISGRTLELNSELNLE